MYLDVLVDLIPPINVSVFELVGMLPRSGVPSTDCQFSAITFDVDMLEDNSQVCVKFFVDIRHRRECVNDVKDGLDEDEDKGPSTN
jgi:hypothetical protein